MKHGKLLGTCAAVLSVGFLLTACGSKSSSGKLADKQVLNWSYASELPTLDPSTATDTISFDMLNNSMEGLYRIGKNSSIQPGLATKTKVSKDGKKYTFTLRKNAKWSNGDKVTAKDFVYSWQRTVAPKTASQYAYLFDGIKNADAINKGKKPLSSLGIKADGNYKLTVTLDKKLPYFKLLMGFPIFFPQNKAAVQKYGKKYGTSSSTMVYDGPFKINKWTGSNLNWNMTKNKDYWDKKAVKLQKINFSVDKSTNTSYNLYQSGKLDFTKLSVEQAKQLSNKKGYQVFKMAQTTYLEYNQKHKVFQNKKIRQAISYAINRKQLASKVLGNGNEPAKGLTSTGLMSYKGKDFANDAYSGGTGTSYNKAKAQKLLKEGLKETGQKKLTFSILGDDTDISKNLTDYLQSSIEQTLPNVKVNTTNVPFKTRLSRSASGNFDTVVTSWGADFSDPISFLDLMTSNNSLNDGKWKNSKYDQLIAASKGKDAGNKQARWNDLVQASKLIDQDQAVAPLVQSNQPVMLNPKVKGLIQNTAGTTYNFKDTYIAK